MFAASLAPRGRTETRNPVRAAALAAARALAARLSLARPVDFWLQELDATWSLGAVRARVLDVVRETHDVRTFVLAPNGGWRGHRAGQFVSVHVEVDGVRLARCYSISSAPGERHVAITVKRVPGGRVSSWMHEHVRPGHVVELGTPAGEFVLAPTPPRKLLLVSGGSGVTPVMSILRDLSRRGAVDDVVFVHAARAARDVLFEGELARLAARHAGLRAVFVVADAPEGSGGGLLDPARLARAVPDLAEREAMLCGPAAMMGALTPAWTERGVGRLLKTERFTAARAEPRPGLAPAKVKLALARSGRTLTAEGTGTLLEELERAGESPAHGCRMGICNTCMCRKRAGVVENTLTGAVSSEPDEDIRLCVSRPRSDIELAI